MYSKYLLDETCKSFLTHFYREVIFYNNVYLFGFFGGGTCCPEGSCKVTVSWTQGGQRQRQCHMKVFYSRKYIPDMISVPCVDNKLQGSVNVCRQWYRQIGAQTEQKSAICTVHSIQTVGNKKNVFKNRISTSFIVSVFMTVTFPLKFCLEEQIYFRKVTYRIKSSFYPLCRRSV